MHRTHGSRRTPGAARLRAWFGADPGRARRRPRRVAAVVLASLTLLVAAACARSSEGAASRGPWEAEGRLQVMDGRTWVVGDRLVTLAANASIAGQPASGAVVKVAGEADASGQLMAQRVEVLQAAPPPPSPSPPPAATRAAPPTVRAPFAPPARDREKRKNERATPQRHHDEDEGDD